jgi:hypothetical protein
MLSVDNSLVELSTCGWRFGIVGAAWQYRVMDISPSQSTAQNTSQGIPRGPYYDAAMRGVMEGDTAAACRLLEVQTTGPPQIMPSSFAFPAGTLSADLLLQVAPNRLVHVEYARRAEPDLAIRMLGYRWAIMRDHPKKQLSQHIVVLGEGRIKGHDDLTVTGFQLDLNVVYLRDLEPATLLKDPSLAPLAALGRGSPSERAVAYGQALRLIQRHGGARAHELTEFATLLGAITLDTLIMGKIAEEVGMIDEVIAELFDESGIGASLVQRGLDRGRVEGIAEGTERGRVEGRVEGIAEGTEKGLAAGRERMLTVLITNRFGLRSEIPAIAHRLAGWSDSAATHAIAEAQSLEQLSRAQPPS